MTNSNHSNNTKQCNEKFLQSLYEMRSNIHGNIERLVRNIDKEKVELWKVEHAG